MANTVPVYTTCYVLRSCTTGDDTVLITSIIVSPSLSAYIGQHVEVVGYPGICFSVELTESGCADCSKSDSILLITPNPICSCNTLIRYFRLEPCNELLPTFYTQQNLYPYDGTTITFFGQGGVCYNVVGVTGGSLPTNISAVTVDCPEPCNCTDQPDAWKITFCDSTGLDPIITSTDLDQYIGAVDTAVFIITYTDGEDTITGCGSVTKTLSQVAPAFTGTFSTIFYDCCEKCTQVCYLLEDCQGAVDPIITCTDLSNYVNQIVKLSNCGDICWKVSESETCDGSILLGTVIENFVPDVIEGNVCIYETNISPEFVTFDNLQIMINNTEYIIDFVSFAQLFIDLNGLGLGTFTASGTYLTVAGNENYGLMCLIRQPKPKICTEPVCSTYTKYCTYKPIRLTAAPDYKIPFFTFTIIINGTTYTGNIPSQSVNDFFIYLNSLNLGVFVRVPSSPVNLIVKVYGNETYGNIQFGGLITDNTCVENENLDFAQACADCLPPLPPEPILDLHIRRIKPGYFSPNSCITTEYMDRINCNFAKQVYDAMLIKRYGITVCCDHDVDAWDIKKQGLDFELLTDPNLCKSTLCYCPAPCLVDVVFTLLPTCVAPILIEATLDTLCYPAVLVDATITVETTPASCNCYTLEGLNYTIGWIDCCCVYQSATYTANATVCAQYTPVILSGTVNINAAGDCDSDLCVIPVSCLCWSIDPNGSTIAGGSYFTCDGILVSLIDIRIPIEVCAPTQPYTSSGIVTLSGGCNIDCGIVTSPTCTCYTVEVTSSDLLVANSDILYYDCLGSPITINLTSLDLPLYICSLYCPKVSLGSLNAEVTITMINGGAPCDPLTCVAPPAPCVDCYEIIATATSSITYFTDCEGVPQSEVVDPGVYRRCSLTYPTSSDDSTTILLAPFDCDSGLCVTPCVAGDPPSCYTITITSSTASLNIISCANTFSNVSTFYNNLTLGTVITTCAQNSILNPIIMGGTATIVNNGPCTVACLDPAPVCRCYRVSVQSGFTGTIDFGWIDCDGIFQTDTAISGNAPIAVCSQSAITFISFTGGAGILSVVASTDNCALGACI